MSVLRVPSFMVDINETNAALDHASRQKAGPGETRLVGVASIHVKGGFAFAFEVHQVRRGRLQPIRHFVGGDAGLDFRIAHCAEVFAIELLDQIKGIALQFLDQFPLGWRRPKLDRPDSESALRRKATA